MNDFDKRFNDTMKLASKGIAFAMVIWVIWAVVVLSILGGIGYVAFHFLAKVW